MSERRQVKKNSRLLTNYAIMFEMVTEPRNFLPTLKSPHLTLCVASTMNFAHPCYIFLASQKTMATRVAKR